MKNKKELIEVMCDVIQQDIKHNKKKIKNIAENLEQYGLSEGKVVHLVNNAKDQLDNIDERLLCLFTEQVFAQADKSDLFINDYFSNREEKESKGYYLEENASLSFPYTFNNVLKVSSDEYIVVSNMEELSSLYNSGLIQYNFDTQREAAIKIMDKKNIIQVPKVNKRRVEEIKKLILEGRLVSSTLTFNARLGTANSGNELVYNPKTSSLTITEETMFDILDGFHRLTAMMVAIKENPSVNMIFTIRVLNYSIPMARSYFEQINRVEVVSRNKLKEMNVDDFTSFIVNRIQNESELRGKIYVQKQIKPTQDFLIGFAMLGDFIDAYFDVKSKKEAIEVSDYLIKFFNRLHMLNVDAFQDNIPQVRKESVVNSNVMFKIYIHLANRFYKENIRIDTLDKIFKQVDFSKNNPLWKDLGLLERNNKNVKRSGHRKTIQYFDSLIDQNNNIDEVI